MALFGLSVAAIGMFLWLSFGGELPVRPQGYRFKVPLTEGAQLVKEADVRISGVNVGKVKKETLDRGGAGSLAEVEIDATYAPVPANTRAILRDKTIASETYLELSPGDGRAPPLPENTTFPESQVDEQVQFDEVLRIFDPETKQATRELGSELSDALSGGAGEDLNNALGNLAPFTVDSADLFQILDSERPDLQRLVRNTGEVFEGLNTGENTLQNLIQNSNATFEALASEQEALRETFAILPTFLDESRRTVLRLDRFAHNTNPLVTRLKPVAADLPPTLRDLRALSPDLRELFIDLRPLIRESPRTLPHGARFVRGLVDEGVTPAAHTFGREANPILSYANFMQLTLSTFLSNGAAAVNYRLGSDPSKGEFKGRPEADNGLGLLGQMGIINDKSLRFHERRPPDERANTYGPNPTVYNRARAFMAGESWDCLPNRPSNGGRGSASTGVQRDAQENFPPCFVAVESLFDGNKFPTLERGEISTSPPARSNEPCDRPTPPPPGSLRAGCGQPAGSPYTE